MNRRAIYPMTTWLVWALGVPMALLVAGFVAVAMTEADTLLL